jgi:Ca2+-transporting ATPase
MKNNLLPYADLQMILGDREEALMLMGFVFVVMGITLYQERKTERALEALRDLSSPRASVIRGGRQKRVAGREVVRGDLLIVREGDRVPADAWLWQSTNLAVDESLLTGESVPVRKQAGEDREAKPAAMARPGGDDTPFIFSGTLVVQGQGIAEVQSIGAQTKIGKALQTVEPERTLLQKETGRLVKRLTILGLSLCALVVVVYGLTRGDWLQGF